MNDRPLPPANIEVREDQPLPRQPSRTEQALRSTNFVEPVLLPPQPVTPEHIHDLCMQAAANADRQGVHGTQPATVMPPRGKHSVLLGCLIIASLSSPWFVGLWTMGTYLWSKLP